ncbi:hypothetical protein [Nocardia abscessus]|uniref:hypothetical protein n=1 Tax=Nocardia abscessus TaxID=120957 RepID=UPI002456D303|nr:hypothetical protein [Nocardia abscessus]
MAIVDRFVSAREFPAQGSTRHETIDPAPEDGTHSRSSDRQDEHASNTGASNLSQHPQRRIIKVVSAQPAGLSPPARACSGSYWSIEASV